MAKVTAIELAKEQRKTNSEKYKGFPYLANGQNNDYPTIIEQLVAGSPTARACSGVIGVVLHWRLKKESRQGRKGLDLEKMSCLLMIKGKPLTTC